MKCRCVVIGLAGVAVIGLAASCSSTKMLSAWTEPTAKDKKLGTVLVIGIAKNSAYRHLYEDQFVKDLAKKHVKALASWQYLPNAAKINKETAAEVVSEQGVTHVLVTRLVDTKTVRTYVQPTTAIMPGSPGYYPDYYNNWSAYYGAGYGVVSTPGYTYDSTYMNLESNLYDVATGKLVWSGLTQTETGGNLDALFSKFIGALMGSMEKSGLL